MSIKEKLMIEKDNLVKVKKPFETAAFLIFAIFLLQQVFYIFINFIDFFQRIGDRNDWVDAGNVTYAVNFSFNSKGTTPNIPLFVSRILNVDSSKFLWIMLTFLFLALWYFLIWLFVWNYCRKRNYAKWTWSALIAFGPGAILLVPTYLLYAVYVFRPYVFRFIRKGVNEYKKYGETYVFDHEQEEDHSEFEV